MIRVTFKRAWLRYQPGDTAAFDAVTAAALVTGGTGFYADPAPAPDPAPVQDPAPTPDPAPKPKSGK
jgi:hypothetical protein